MTFKNSRLYCTFDKVEGHQFFSLDDYLNNLFTSNDPKKIIKFYEWFDDRDQLIRWMKERPKGVANIHEVEGNKDIIVVIPTADYNGKYAKECRDNVFKGLHIVFVESGVNDFYFNYAHNCNVGIRKAMEYNPKWVVVSNDDVYKIDDVKILKNELLALDGESYLVLTKNPGQLHSLTEHIGEGTFMRKFLLLSSEKYRNKYKIEKKFGVRILTWRDWYNQFIIKIFYKEIISVKATYAFGVISNHFINMANLVVFDEIYINGMEDIDLSMRINKDFSQNVNFINYEINSLSGTTIGVGEFRVLRDILNKLYFQEKFYGKSKSKE